MIQRDTNRRKLRNSRKKKCQLEFEKLEDRKMMAADILMQPAMSEALGPQTTQHSMPHNIDVVHAATPTKDCNGQHHNPALMALVSDASATHVAISSGDWSSSTTWQNGVVPAAGARVVIAKGQTVNVDRVFNEEFKTIRVDGTLKFATNVDTQLKVDTLVSTHCGRLEIGTATNPIQSNVTAKVIFADDGAIDRNWDPTQLSRGALLMGATEIHGAQTTDTVTAAIQPRKGDTSVQLSAVPTNWKAGDEVVITGTQGATSDEVRTISSISGSTVRFNQGLALDHVTPNEGLNVYVANKTRNVQFSSENTAIARRGHIMLMHTYNVSIDFAEFKDLGRTDKSKDLDDVQFEFTEDAVGNDAGAPTVYSVETNPNANNIRGRYSLHFHRGGVDPTSTPARVNGSVVDGSPGWGFVNHSSHVNFTSNVAYGVWGSAYYTETGDEVGTFDGNIAIRSVNPRNPVDPDSREIATDLGHNQQEFGNSGDGFWLSGHLVSVKNNISSGNSGHGIIIWSDGLVEHDLGANSGRTTVKTANIANGHLITGRTEIPTWWAPLAEVSNNEVSNAVIGFRTRYIHSKGYLGEGGSAFHKTPDQAYVDTLNPVVDGLKVWGSREGVMLNYSERMSLKNSEIIGTGEPFVNQAGTTNVGVGLDLGNDISRGSGRIQNVTIEGFGLGMFAPRNEQWVMDNLNLSNTTDVLITKTTLSPRTLTMSNINFGSLDGTAVSGTENQRRNIAFLANPEFTEFDGQPFAFLMPDQITIDGQQIYADYQNANYVPLPEAPDSNDLADVPSSWVRRTNQQLQNQIDMSTAGNITPAGSQTVSWIDGGRLGPLSPASTQFPQLFDMTNGGFSPEPFPGGPAPELTGNRLEISSGETVVFMNTNLNTTDTNTGIADLTYTVSQVQNGMFVHRDAPSTPITNFTQAEVNGGVIRFIHDGSEIKPAYQARVTDGTTTTGWSQATVFFDGGSGNENRPPVANNDSAMVAMNGVVEISVLNNDTDPDGDRLTVQSFGQPSNGVVTNNDGVLTYTPNAGFTGADSFIYTVSDGSLTDSASVSIEVTEDNNRETQEIGYSGTVRTNHLWAKVNLPRSFENPVVVAGGASRNGGHQGVVRIRNVTSNSFEIRFEEWNYLDGAHAYEDIGYLVVEAGTHELTDGTKIVAGTIDLIHERVDSVEFENEFDNVPVVISQIMTRNGGATVTDRLVEVTESGFELHMNEEEAADHRHNRETVGWIAIDQGSAVSGESRLNALLADGITHRVSDVEFGNLGTDNPVVLTDMQTRNGGDNATVRHYNQTNRIVSLFLEEEQSANDEVRHARETVGLVAFEPGMLVANATNNGLKFASISSTPESDSRPEFDAAMGLVAAQRKRQTELSNSISTVPLNERSQPLNLRENPLQLASSQQFMDSASEISFETDDDESNPDRSFDVSLDSDRFDMLDEAFVDFV
ncbi:MAG: Ig-like domain-containing protein [Planctomycetota bacterium]